MNHIEQIHQNMLEIYESSNDIEKINRLKNKEEKDPIFYPYQYHDEEVADKRDINVSDIEILHDMLIIGNEIKLSAINYSKLISRSRLNLLNIERSIHEALEYKRDMELYNTDNIVNISDVDCYGDFTYIDNSFMLRTKEDSKNQIYIKNVIGNGYEGNKYVISDDNKIEFNIIDTSNRNNMLNDRYDLPYEYSRINISNNETEKINNNFNYGDTPAKCVMDLEFKNPSSMLMITVYGEPITINKIEHSNDGINYNDVEIEKQSIRINELIHYPSSKFLKLHCESTKPTNEIISNPEDEKVKIQKNGKRNRISISSIKTNRLTFFKNSTFKTRELVNENEKIKAVAIYSEETNNINKEKASQIEYKIIVNGKITDIAPINSGSDKVKIISNSKRAYKEDRTMFIDEEITSVQLLINLVGKNENESPVVKNLKILKY